MIQIPKLFNPENPETPKTVYPLLPLRDIVVFPHMVAPLFVGRKRSVNALTDAMNNDKTVFLTEVQQGGLFLIQGFSEEETDALMGVAAPNVLFPYARETVSDLVTRGSFPQFVLQPVNFEAIYAQQRQAKAAKAEGGTAH